MSDLGIDDDGMEEQVPDQPGRSKKDSRRVKGRGADDTEAQRDHESRFQRERFEQVESDGPGGKGPAKSVEGWIIFVMGIHEEATEEGWRMRMYPAALRSKLFAVMLDNIAQCIRSFKHTVSASS